MTDLDSVSNHEAESLSTRVSLRKISGRQILITGGSGMVGGYIASSLLKSCDLQGLPSPKLTLLSRNKDSVNLRQFSGSSHVTVIETELSSWRVDKSYDILIHAASPASPT